MGLCLIKKTCQMTEYLLRIRMEKYTSANFLLYDTAGMEMSVIIITESKLFSFLLLKLWRAQLLNMAFVHVAFVIIIAFTLSSSESI